METNVNSTYPIIPKHYLQVSNEKEDLWRYRIICLVRRRDPEVSHQFTNMNLNMFSAYVDIRSWKG